MNDLTNEQIREEVRTQYARVARGEVSCMPGCCGPNPEASRSLGYSDDELKAAPDGANLGLGCGNPQAIAALRPGETVLDLGSGAGFDSFLAARQVGPTGKVYGVDMTPDMITKARGNAQKAGHGNVDFRLGEIEHLPIEDRSVDVILSNCVLNLVPDKAQAFREAFRVLRPGGRLAVSDVVLLRPLSAELANARELYVGCISGAALVSEIESHLRAAGFEDVRVVPREGSRATIASWFPGSGAEDYVASASIEARRPGKAAPCCAPGCCG